MQNEDSKYDALILKELEDAPHLIALVKKLAQDAADRENPKLLQIAS